jgi:16S rRNA C967 or C1407 C5-methylase (RsmB/RsmF family)
MAAADFFSYYSNLFGDRWDGLLAALSSPVNYKELTFGQSLEPYFMDEASWFAAMSLPVEPGMDVLDMCAAPGGKTLVLAGALQGDGFLQSNDRSSDRRVRLRRVIDASLPESYRQIITVTGHDAARFGLHRKESFDRILLDAPCSSERHVIESAAHLAEWSQKRIAHLAQQQGSMLAAAVDALRPGGVLVYSTCALSAAENDQVVSKILKKRAEKVRVVEIASGFEGTDRTEFGLQMLPDHCAGRGPIYCARLEKNL